jgi:hypothetical protein
MTFKQKSMLALALLVQACASSEPIEVQPGGWCDDNGCYAGEPPLACNFPEGAYTATYTKLNGTCGQFETESFAQDDERFWFPLAVRLDDCEQVINCDDGIILGSSFCSRASRGSYGTLDAKLTFTTPTNDGLLELEIVGTNPHHGTSVCNSAYHVTYSKE